MSGDGRRRSTLGLAGLLALCCVSLPVLFGGAAAVGGTAGVTAVATGVSSVRALGVTVLVTGITLVPVYVIWRRYDR